MATLALKSDQIPNIGTGVLIAIVVIGLLLTVFITSLVGRLVIALVVIALGIYVWQQRSAIENHLTKDKCQLNTTFFGIHVKAPADVVKACQQQVSR